MELSFQEVVDVLHLQDEVLPQDSRASFLGEMEHMAEFVLCFCVGLGSVQQSVEARLTVNIVVGAATVRGCEFATHSEVLVL